ncbi:MAG: thermonuclease family protein [Rhizobiaceae bacterium]|nr:thermonuclease family protein [Rhizobiaceae bacterium]
MLRMIFLCLLLAAAPARAETIAGPVEARVLRVIDGDSFVAEARVWPGHVITVNVRIRGIDAPELRSSCAAERVAAERSRTALAAMIGAGPVGMTNIGGGKFYGRVLADVTGSDGRPLASAMTISAFAKPYSGGKRTPYCG